jgi:iron complex transport system ATP-binding protein
MRETFLQLDHASVVRGDKAILDSIDLKIMTGEHAVILGPNGSGKSTLFKLITGDIRTMQDKGVPIRLFGLELWNVFDVRKMIGFVSNDLQDRYKRDVSGLDAVLSGFFGSIGLYEDATPEQISKAKETAMIAGAQALLGKSMEVMSSGESKRILIARALVNEPKVLVLDEPANSLDISSKISLFATLRHLAREHCTLLLITHNIEEIIPEIDRVIMLKDGKVFRDGDKKRTLTSENISQLFDMPLEISQIPDGSYACSPVK